MMEKAFDPKSFETRLYEWWMKSGFFAAQDESSKPPFSIMMPPPNITGALHNGHALFLTIEDALARWKRMSGYNVLWLPGTDHAGIATQMVVERELKKEGKDRHQMGRKAFLERVWQWREKHGAIIVHQMQKMGASADWSRLQFTMDPHLSRTVREVFVRLYEQGLIYRGTRLINWCVRCRTALSDLEVLPKERKGHFYHIKYVFESDPSQFVEVATTRPETLLGDTAVAVHPEDERYQSLIGKALVLPLLGPLLGRKIPLIADSYVDKEFGSGALKVTPGHDFNDYELGLRHKLQVISLFEKDGRVTHEGGPYQELKISEAREKVLEDLKAQGLLIQTREVTHQVGCCERCDTVVEPMISDQWFMNVKPLAEKAIEAVKKGEELSLAEVDRRTDAIKILPSGWTATYYQWMENIRDWCISRQLWWGHQIPAWYCGDCGKVSVSRSDLTACMHCKSESITQDEDVLDTWFSSGLWPFSTLGWPQKTKALKTFYPSSVMETGFDILFFWVARMIMMGMHFNEGRVPFHRIYLHAMVRDEKGQKMSKTKGNVLDPLDIIKDYGADAFRFTLCAMAGQGRDVKLSIDRIEGYKAFCNKLWNASRYVLMRVGEAASLPSQGKELESWVNDNYARLHVIDQWVLSRLAQVTEKVNQGLEEFRLNESTSELYHFIWNEYCDWYIEFSKVHPTPETQVCLLFVLEQILKLAHPLIPFVTEEIYQHLPNTAGRSLMMQSYPKPSVRWINKTAEEIIEVWKETTDRIRAFRGENGISPKARMKALYEIADPNRGSIFENGKPFIVALAGLESLEERGSQDVTTKEWGKVLSSVARVFIPLTGLVDVEGELKRLEKEKAQAIADIEFVKTKLSKPEFVSKAPPALVEKERQKLKGYEDKLAQLIEAEKKLRA